jgi:hypothetical protein
MGMIGSEEDNMFRTRISGWLGRTSAAVGLALASIGVVSTNAYAMYPASCTGNRLQIYAQGYPGVYCYKGTGTYAASIYYVTYFKAWGNSYSVEYEYQGTWHLVNLLDGEYRNFSGSGAHIDWICAC